MISNKFVGKSSSLRERRSSSKLLHVNTEVQSGNSLAANSSSVFKAGGQLEVAGGLMLCSLTGPEGIVGTDAQSNE